MRLSDISEQVKNDAPVFIVGEARSGTSMLYRTIQKHSMFCPKELNLVEARIMWFSSRSFLLKNGGLPNPLRYMLNDRVNYERFLASIRGISLMHRLLFPRINIKLTKAALWWWVFNLNHLMLRSFFYFAKKARGPERIVEKTPKTLLHSPNLRIAFPKCRLIYIYRHPIDVYTSYIKRSQFDVGKAWLKLTPFRFCKMYEHDMRSALTVKDRMKDSLLLITYEDFTQSPRREFRKVCSFLDVPFEEGAIVERNPDLTKWKANPHLFGEITAKTKNWKDYVSLSDARHIEDYLDPIMRSLGYQRYTTA